MLRVVIDLVLDRPWKELNVGLAQRVAVLDVLACDFDAELMSSS